MSNLELLEHVDEDREILSIPHCLAPDNASPPDNAPAHETLATPTDVPEAAAAPHHASKPSSLIARLALASGSFCGACYDLQMQLGGGVRVVKHRVVLPHFPTNAPPLRAAFISDLHYGPTSGRVAARRAWRLAHEAQPDIVFLGGDYFYGDESGLPILLRELQRWKHEPPPAGIYACLGNHDHLANVDAIVTCLEACGVRVLINDAVELPSPWDGVWIAGADDTLFGDPQPELALASVPRNACAIMLAHSPDICQFSAQKRCGLTLCGHTHGGQICLPNGDAMYMPSHWGRHYPHGLHRHAGAWVFVSRGVGTVGLPLRLWSPPDIAVLELAGRGGIWK